MVNHITQHRCLLGICEGRRRFRLLGLDVAVYFNRNVRMLLGVLVSKMPTLWLSTTFGWRA